MNLKSKSKKYPSWICHDCGIKYGSARFEISCHHMGKCGWCKKYKVVTEPRDYNYPPIVNPIAATYWEKNEKEKNV